MEQLDRSFAASSQTQADAFSALTRPGGPGSQQPQFQRLWVSPFLDWEYGLDAQLERDGTHGQAGRRPDDGDVPRGYRTISAGRK
jgi:hypothetical protein